MLGAVHPRRAGVQERLELAAVEVPPGPFLGVVVDGKDPVALRTGKERPLRMARPGVHALVANGELDPAHLPRGTRGPTGSGKAPCLASDMVARPFTPPPANICSPTSPTENPEAPKFELDVELKREDSQ